MSKVYKYFNSEIKSVDDEARVVRFIASTEDIDRDNEKILSSGWKLEKYKRNPIILWGHNYNELPLGKGNVWVDNNTKSLMVDATFATMEENSKADSVYKMIKSGMLNAVSVGFVPNFDKIIYGEKKGQPRTTYTEQELLEISVVPVPSNPNAIVTAKSVSDIFTQSITDNVLDNLEVNELQDSIEYFLKKYEIIYNTKQKNDVSDINKDNIEHICECCKKELSTVCPECKKVIEKELFLKELFDKILFERSKS